MSGERQGDQYNGYALGRVTSGGTTTPEQFAQAAQDAADLEAGRALRRLVESGREITIGVGDEVSITPESTGWLVGGMHPYVIGTYSTLPAAVTAALEG